MRRVGALVLLTLLAGCATVRPAPDVEPPDTQPIDTWARVLGRFVDARGRVDFERLKHDRTDLDRYVAWIYAVG
ncbi:MAG: hypothetical protein H0W93_08635, partial [Gammaproteobacteria bacterium]|nr:hypothetical protein [Gammaproteobacteria bacterium]